MRAGGILLVASAILMAPSAVHAAPLLSGGFSSTASSGSFLTQSGTVDVTGTSITGTFALSSALGATQPTGFAAAFGPGAYLLPPGAIVLTFNIAAIGETVTFTTAGSSENSLVELADNGTTQSVLLEPAFIDPHLITTVSLTGPEGSLFDSVTDPASLHTGAGVTVASPIFLSVYQQGGANLVVTSQSIPVTTPVDEPSTWSITAIALIGTLAVQRKRRHP